MRKPVSAKAAPPKGTAAKAKDSPKRSHSEMRFAVVLAILVATPLAAAQAIAKAEGALGHEYMKRLINHLQTYHSFDDPPRNTRPRLYTDEVFEAALDLLSYHVKDITQLQLVEELQSIGVLPEGSHDEQYFFKQLKAYCQERGLEAKAGVTRAESFLQKSDHPNRVDHVERLQKHMKDKGYKESDLVFMDETSVNASNHPKCKHRCLPAGTMQHVSLYGQHYAWPCNACSFMLLLRACPPSYLHAADTATRLSPTIVISGITPPRQRHPWSNHGKEGSYKVAVYLQQDKLPCTVPTVARTSDGKQLTGKPYLYTTGKRKGQPMAGMGAEEACDMLDVYLQWRKQHCKRTEVKRFLLILDNDPTHKSEEFKAHCAARGVDFFLLPPRSHDLSPPDSYFFAVVKNAWRRAMSDQPHLTWPQRKELFNEQILKTKVNPHVVGYSLRLEACKLAKGQRFATQLAALKSGKGRGA
jgi:DDE superfamily endonuclease